MLIVKQFNKLILQQIEDETQESVSFLKKRNYFGPFTRNYKSFASTILLSDLIYISIKWHNIRV